MTERVLINSCKCRSCGEVVYSRSRHDFSQCGCGNVAADGGNEYIRRVGNPTDIEERSISMDGDDFKKLQARLDAIESMMVEVRAEIVTEMGHQIEKRECFVTDWDKFEERVAKAFNAATTHGIGEIEADDYKALREGYVWAVKEHRNLFGKICGIARYVQNDREKRGAPLVNE